MHVVALILAKRLEHMEFVRSTQERICGHMTFRAPEVPPAAATSFRVAFVDMGNMRAVSWPAQEVRRVCKGE